MQGSKRGALASRELNTPTQCNVDFGTALTSPDSVELRHVSRVRITSMTRSARRLRFLASREGTYSYLSNYLPCSLRNFPFHRVNSIMNPMSLLCPSAMGNSYRCSGLNLLPLHRLIVSRLKACLHPRTSKAAYTKV